MSFAGIALKLGNVGPTFASFNLCPSLAETERKYLAFEKDIKWRGSPLKAIFDGLF